MELSRRAETHPPGHIQAATVDVGGLYTRLATRDHQLITGPEGAGKTHALLYLQAMAEQRGETAVYIDLRGAGTSRDAAAGADTVHATAIGLFQDIVGMVVERLTPPRRGRGGRSSAPALDDALGRLDASVRRMVVVGEAEAETQVLRQEDIQREMKGSLNVSLQPGASLGASRSSSRQAQASNRLTTRGEPAPLLRYAEVSAALRDVVDALPRGPLLILIDEWHAMPRPTQPHVGDMLRRAVLPVPGVTCKIAAIGARTTLAAPLVDGTEIGLRSGRTLAEVSLARLLAGAESRPLVEAVIGSDVAGRADAGALDALTWFAEVPRDAIEIAAAAAGLACEGSISTEHVVGAARDRFERDTITRLRDAGSLALFRRLATVATPSRSGRLLLLPAGRELEPRVSVFSDERAMHLRRENALPATSEEDAWDLWEIDRAYFPHDADEDWDEVPVEGIVRVSFASLDREQRMLEVPSTSSLAFERGSAAVPVRIFDAGMEYFERVEPIAEKLPPGQYLILFEDASTAGDYVVPIQDAPLRIGRSLRAEVRFDDATVSRSHAVVKRDDEHGIRILDDRSLNGLFVNGKRVERAILQDRDLITIGRHTIAFVDVGPEMRAASYE